MGDANGVNSLRNKRFRRDIGVFAALKLRRRGLRAERILGKRACDRTPENSCKQMASNSIASNS